MYSFLSIKKVLYLFLFALAISCKSSKENGGSFGIYVDEYIARVQKENGVPGIALGIVKNDKVIHQKNYGFANLEHQVKVYDSSIFRLYSLTKPIVAAGIFQLIEKGDLNLEDKIVEYIDSLPKNWQDAKLKHLLSFSSGLPELIEPYQLVKDQTESQVFHRAFKDSLHFESGERFEYNQTNFWAIQKIIEEVTESKLSDFILKNQFKESSSVFFSSDSRDIIKNRATPYFPFEKGTLTITHPYYQGDYSHAMNGLHVTLKDFIQWDRQFTSNQFLSQETKDQMWSEFPYRNDDDIFTYGWGKYITNGISSYGFSGSGSVIYRTFPEKDISIIYLSNGFTKNYDLNKVIDDLYSRIENTQIL